LRNVLVGHQVRRLRQLYHTIATATATTTAAAAATGTLATHHSHRRGRGRRGGDLVLVLVLADSITAATATAWSGGRREISSKPTERNLLREKQKTRKKRRDLYLARKEKSTVEPKAPTKHQAHTKHLISLLFGECNLLKIHLLG
jgi:hypothetical protein